MSRERMFPNWARLTATNFKAKRRTSDRGRIVQTCAVVCAAIGIDTNLTLAYQVFALLLALLVVSRFSLKLRAADVTVKRHLPKYASVDEPFEYTITVRNLSDFVETDLELVDNPLVVPPDSEQYQRSREPGEETRNLWDRWIGFHRFIWLQRLNTGVMLERARVPNIGVKASADARIKATPLRRGIVTFKSTTLLRPDPFGLIYAVTHFKQGDHLLVLPRRYPVARTFDLQGGRNFQPGGVNPTWSIGESDEFVSLRDYRPGDSKKHIHWPSTAKRDKPVVKEFQDEFFVRQALVLDTDIDSENADILEAAISVATSLVLNDRSSDGLMDLIFVQDSAQVLTSGRGLAQSNQQLEALATMSATQSTTRKLIDTLEQHSRLMSSCVLILGGWDENRKALLAAATARGVPVTLFVISDRSLDVPGYLLHPEKLESQLAAL